MHVAAAGYLGVMSTKDWLDSVHIIETGHIVTGNTLPSSIDCNLQSIDHDDEYTLYKTSFFLLN